MVQQEDDQGNSDFFANDAVLLGRRLLQANNPAAALPLLRRALEILKAQGDTLATVETMLNLGICYVLLGQWTEVEAQYNDALILARDQLGATHPLAAQALEQLGNYKYLSGEYDEAVHHLRQAISIYQEHWPEPTLVIQSAKALRKLGEWYAERGQLVEAESVLRESLDALTLHGLSQTEREQSSDRLFRIYSQQGRLRDAAHLMSETLVIDARRFWQDLVKVTQMAREKLLRQHRADVDRLLSNLIVRWPTESYAAQVALDVLLWRRGFGLELYRRANRAGQSNPALQAKLDELRSMRATFAKIIFDLPIDPKVPYRTQIHWEGINRSPEIDMLEVEIFSSLSEEDCHPVFYAPDHVMVASRLPSDAALIEFWRCCLMTGTPQATPRYLALVLLPGNPPETKIVDLCSADEIETELLMNFLARLIGEPADLMMPRGLTRHATGAQNERTPDDQTWRTLGAQLRKLVFDPLLPALGDAKRLFIVPDGLLPRLPFGVLPMNNEDFVFDTYEICYLNSGRELFTQGSLTGQSGPPVVIAAPDYNLHQGESRPQTDASAVWFPDLPGARAEGEEVAKRLGVKPILGKNATSSSLKEVESPRILHISTHGVLLPVRPMIAEIDVSSMMQCVSFRVETHGTVEFQQGLGRLSGRSLDDQALRSVLAFAGVNSWLSYIDLPAEAENGWLNAEDIAQINLAGNDLTVLSACETALGSIQIGEGVLGLRSAFHVAGTRTLVMSLWRIPDELTRQLMMKFYDYLSDTTTGRAEALHKAQMDLRKRYPDRPDYWGAFICQGDPGPLPL